MKRNRSENSPTSLFRHHSNGPTTGTKGSLRTRSKHRQAGQDGANKGPLKHRDRGIAGGGPRSTHEKQIKSNEHESKRQTLFFRVDYTHPSVHRTLYFGTAVC